MTVDIVCSVRNGAPYLGAFLQSLQAQTHAAWRLWVRDDESSDDSADIVRRYAAADPRIHLSHTGAPRLGVVAAFGWLLERAPADSARIMFADADDVWMPDKIEYCLAEMDAAERRTPGPLLVHTDLVVVDRELREIHPSFWHYAGITPDSVSLRHLIVRNVVTGAATMINGALRERVGAIPRGAAVHDWWCACVASLTGHIVALPRATVLYRQHGANITGARRPSSTLGLRALAREAPGAFRRTAKVRADIASSAAQARAFLERYAADLSAADRAFLDEYARIPERQFFRRKLDVMRMQLLPENGWVQNAGILLRA